MRETTTNAVVQEKQWGQRTSTISRAKGTEGGEYRVAQVCPHSARGESNPHTHHAGTGDRARGVIKLTTAEVRGSICQLIKRFTTFSEG